MPATAAGDSDAEAALRERVEAALAFASRGDWLATYEFYTLSFRDSCPGETFAVQATSEMNLFRGKLGLPLTDP